MREQSQKLQVASEKSQDLEAVAFGSWIWKGSMKNTVTHLWDLQGGYENQLWQLWFIYVNLDSLWLFNIAMENGPFLDGSPIKNGDFPWLTVSHNQMINTSNTIWL
jgi:hypothetical protein